MEKEPTMHITEEDMRRAGRTFKKCAYDDEELALMIKAHKLTVAFLEGLGQGWELALSPLRRELETLEHLQTIRRG